MSQGHQRQFWIPICPDIKKKISFYGILVYMRWGITHFEFFKFAGKNHFKTWSMAIPQFQHYLRCAVSKSITFHPIMLQILQGNLNLVQALTKCRYPEDNLQSKVGCFVDKLSASVARSITGKYTIATHIHTTISKTLGENEPQFTKFTVSFSMLSLGKL